MKKTYIYLHILLMVFSISEVLSKITSNFAFLSFGFCLCYAGEILILGIYAIFWQQIIKKMPLTVAYMNKSVSIIWGIIWGILLFKETISVGKIIGSILVLLGILIYANNCEENNG